MDRKEIEKEISVVAERIATMIEPLSDTTMPIKNSNWTIGDAAAHLVISAKLFHKVLEGTKNPYKVGQRDPIAEVNDKLLKEFPERNGKKLAQLLNKETKTFLQIERQYPVDFKIKTHLGSMDLMMCLSYNLCHLLIHGCTIAINLNKPVPIEEKHLAMTQLFRNKATLHFYDKEKARNFYATIVIHLRDFSRYAIICEGSHISITDTIPNKTDCTITIDPISYFLISTGVIGQWKPLLQGKVFISGKRPWLALRLMKLFKTP